MANVPSFRLLGPRNTKNHTFFCGGSTAGKTFWRKFRYRGTSAKTTFWKLPFANARSQGPKTTWNGKVQTNICTSNSEQFEGITHENVSGQVRPRQGTEICNLGAPSPLEALHWLSCFFSSIYVQFSKTSPLKSGESSEKSGGENRVKSCHVCGCHGFFGPDLFIFPSVHTFRRVCSQFWLSVRNSV